MLAKRPAAIPVLFKPAIRQVNEPAAGAHRIPLPAWVKAATAVALIAEIWVLG